MAKKKKRETTQKSKCVNIMHWEYACLAGLLDWDCVDLGVCSSLVMDEELGGELLHCMKY